MNLILYKIHAQIMGRTSKGREMKQRHLIQALMASTVIAGWSSAALAQSSADTQEDEIIVVGTHIQGAKITETLPVTVIDSTDIQATGDLTFEELLGNIPQAGELAFNSDRELSNDARGDIASLNLRTLGADTSLVLVNGRRIVSHAQTQTFNGVPIQFTNMNAIPTSGLGRIEVLRDGASAIYGSDAVAGVLNAVIRDDYDGLKLNGRYGFSEGTDLSEILVRAHGGGESKTGETRYSASVGYFDRTGLDANERSYSFDGDKRALLDPDDPFFGNIRLRNDSSFGLYGEFRVGTPDTSSDFIRGRRVRLADGTSLTTSSGQFHIQPTSIYGGTSQAGYLFNPDLGLEIDDGSSTSSANNIDGPNGFAINPLRYNMNEFRKLTPDTKRWNFSFAASHDVSEDVEAFGDFIYYNSDSSKFFGPPLISTSNNFTIPANYYWNPFGPTTLPDGSPNPNRIQGIDAPDEGYDVQIRRTRFIDLGPRLIDVKQDQWRGLFGLRGQSSNWDWETALGYSESESEDVGLLVSRSLLHAELSRTDPGAYNVFSGNTGNGNSGERFGVDVTRKSKNSLLTLDARVSRPDLLTLFGNDVGTAIGVEYRKETIDDDRDSRLDGSMGFTNPITGQVFDSDIAGVSATPDVEASRGVFSAYAEAIVPIVQDKPMMKSLEFQLAARYENYSDVDGDVLKPRIAGSWFINDDFQLRGAWSQGFRAPNLIQVNQPFVERFTNSQIDYSACTFYNECGGDAVIARTAGNPDLQPETSDNLSFGATYQPSFIDGLTLTADYWDIQLDDSVGVVGRRNHIALDEYLRRTQGTSNAAVVRDDPTAEQIAAADAYNMANGTNIAAFGTIRFVNDQFLNLAKREVSGLDFGGEYRFDTSNMGDFRIKANVAHLLKYDQLASDLLAPLTADPISSTGANNDGAAFLDPESVGDLIRVESRPKWRYNASIRWDMDQFRMGATLSYVGSVFDPDVTATNADGDTINFPIDSFTRVGLYGQYAFDEGTLDGSVVKVGVRNIFDEDPPLFDNSAGYSSSLHSNRGRYWYFDVSKKF